MHPIDITIVVVYVLLVLGAGIWFGKRQTSTWRYFVASNDIPWWAIAISIVATETSTITFISVPGMAWARGGDFRFLQMVLGYLLARVLISVLFMPWYFRGELVSVYDLLRGRFDGRVKGLAATLFVMMRTIADGVRLLLTAYVIVAVLRMSSVSEGAISASVIGLGVVMIVFSLIGGIEAIIWIEVVQFGIYLLGAIAASLVLMDKVPLDTVLAAGAAAGKFDVFDFSFDLTRTYTFWAGLIGGTFLTISTHGTDQYLVQRYLCTDNQRNASKALLASGVMVMIQFAGFLFIGVQLWAFYGRRGFRLPDQVFPHFIANYMPVGLTGLVVAAILAAALSSSLNSIAATVTDLYREFDRWRDDERDMVISRGVTVLAGIAQIGVGLLMQYVMRSALSTALAVASVINGPILGVYFLGLTKRPDSGGALAGMFAGLGAVGWIAFMTDVTWPWYAAAGSITTFLVGYLWPLDTGFAEEWEE